MNDTETFLARFRPLDWTHEPEFELDRIDLVASIANQVRFAPIDRPTVERYVAALDDGAVFPPVILRRQGDRLVMLGGNHRVRAHLDAGRDTIDAYIIECPDLVALEISYADNATHGLPPTDAERVTHALTLIDRGHTVTRAARTVGIDPQRIHKIRAVHSVERRAVELDVAADLALVPLTVRPRLASLGVDRVFTATIRAIATETMGSVEAVKMIGDLNAQPGADAQLELLDLFVDQHRASIEGRRKVGHPSKHPSKNPYVMLRTALGTVRHLNPSDVVEAVGRNGHRADLARLCMDGARHLKVIHDLAKEHER